MAPVARCLLVNAISLSPKILYKFPLGLPPTLHALLDVIPLGYTIYSTSGPFASNSRPPPGVRISMIGYHPYVAGN